MAQEAFIEDHGDHFEDGEWRMFGRRKLAAVSVACYLEVGAGNSLV